MKKVSLGLLILCMMVSLCSCTKSKEKEDTPKDYTAHEVSVLFINVGRADSCLVQVDDKSYLIDTGEDEGVPAILGALANQNVTSLDGVILTHTHSDHIGGFKELSNLISVDALYGPKISILDKDGSNKITELANETSIELTQLSKDDTIQITDDVAFEVLGPIAYDEEEDNNNSLVLKLTVNGKTFLFTGDMQFPEEESLMGAGVDFDADILKVANHGNKDATSDEFANAVSPSVAIIPTDTEIDSNSANKRVKAALADSDIYVTEDYDLGVLVQITEDSEIKVSDAERKSQNLELEITDGDADAQTITVTNNGEKADVSGAYLFSDNGEDAYIFPDNTFIGSGESIVIEARKLEDDETVEEGTYVWDKKKLWKKDNKNTVVLYDRYGNELSEMVC